EDAISSVSGIDEISVYSFEGFAYITCTFVLERDIEGAAQDIREKVAGAIDRLPRDTLPPIITKQDRSEEHTSELQSPDQLACCPSWSLHPFPYTTLFRSEDAISSVSGIDEISVYSFEGFAYITCTFVLERDIEGAAQDIREKVAGAIDRLPRDTLPPIITKQD